MSSKVIPTLAAALIFLAFPAAPGLACTFHQTGVGSFFEPTYPGSLEVAAATARARSEGRLADSRLERGLFGLARATGAMRDLGGRLELAPEAAMTDFYLILAGQQLWTDYRVTEIGGAQAFGVQVHADAPRDGTPVAVTSYDTVVALLAGTLSPQEAADTGLLRFRLDGSGRVRALFGEAFSVEKAAQAP
ncbi:MAG: hypothetical protein QNJ67_09665 [Kiloniellales bacterium]|nr:hypothetical protein [Kiloniellales bacterium]